MAIISLRRVCALLVFTLAGTLACATAAIPRAGGESAAAEIRARLESSAVGWNEGDLARYLTLYVDTATAMGDGPGEPQRGRAAIEQGMRAGFWRTGRPLQVLTYRGVEVRVLDSRAALAIGHFVLTGGGRPERVGSFTTVWTLTADGWRIVHDHSG